MPRDPRPTPPRADQARAVTLPANPTGEQLGAFVAASLRGEKTLRGAFTSPDARRTAMLELMNYGRQYLAQMQMRGLEVESWVDVLDAIRRDVSLVYGAMPASYATIEYEAAERAWEGWHAEQAEKRQRSAMPCPVAEGDDEIVELRSAADRAHTIAEVQAA